MGNFLFSVNGEQTGNGPKQNHQVCRFPFPVTIPSLCSNFPLPSPISFSPPLPTHTPLLFSGRLSLTPPPLSTPSPEAVNGNLPFLNY